MSSSVTIRINHQAKTVGSQLVQAGQGRHAPMVLQVAAGQDLQLVDPTTGRGPRRVFTQRVGNDLHLSLEGGDIGQPDVIVPDYYQRAGVHLLGQGADGQFYAYVGEAGAATAAPTALAAGAEAPSAAHVLASSEGLANPWWSSAASTPAAAAAGAGSSDMLLYGGLGLGALGALGAGGGKGGSNGPGSLAAPTVSVSANGLKLSGSAPAGASVQLDINNDGVTDFTAVADASGHYEVDLTVPLVDGQTVSARAVNAAGASSPVATGLAPDFPMLVTVSDDGSQARVRYAAPGATVTIADAAGHVLGTAVAGADGTATVALAAPQLNGQVVAVSTATEQVQAQATDTTPPALQAALDAASNTGATQDAITSDTTPTVSGDSEPGARISVLIAGQTLSTVAAPNGTWSVTPSALADGSYSAVVTATDAAGNASSQSVAIVVDTRSPPVLSARLAAASDTGLAGDNLTISTTPTFVGTGEAGASVSLVIGGQTLNTQVAADGSWSLTPTQALSNGSYTAAVTTTNGAGQSSTASVALTVAVASLPLTAGMDASSDTGLAGDSTTNQALPTFSGMAQPGTAITVNVAGQVLSTVTAADGHWSVAPSLALADGAHTAVVSSSDVAGNMTSQNVVLTVDTQAPSVTAGLDPASDTGALGDRVTQINTPLLTGTGEPGAAVTVAIGSQTLSTTVAADGRWSLTTGALAEGASLARVTTTDAAGNSSTVFMPVKVDTQAPAVTANLALASDTGVQGDSITRNTLPSLSGSGEPGAAIRVQIAGQTLNTTVSPAGSWSVTPLVALPDGATSAQITATDAAGNSTSTSLTLQIDNGAPALYAELSASSDTGTAGDNLTRDDTPTLSGFGEAGALISVLLGSQTLTTTVGSNGQWSVTANSLADASYTANVTATDAAGNSSSASVNLRVDTASTSLSARLDPASDSGSAGDGLTRDDTPTLSGTGEAGARISVDVAGQWLTTTVAGDGTWSVTPNVMVAGPASAVVTQTDGAGNSSSTSVAFSIDTVAPLAPLTTLVADGNNDGYLNGAELGAASTVLARVTIPAGTVAGDTLRVSDGTATQTVVLSAAQAALPIIDLSFAAPAHGSTLSFTATLTDRAGNASLVATDSAQVDLSAPGAPTITITTDSSADGVLDAGELGAASTVLVTVGLPGDAALGDTLYVMDNAGNARNMVITSAWLIAGAVPVSFPLPAEGATLEVSAQLVDSASNAGPLVTAQAVRDSFANTAPLIEMVTDVNNDGYVSADEWSATLLLHVTLPTAGTPPVVGDTLTITDSSNTTVAQVVLDASMLLNGWVDLSLPVPAEGQATTLTATLSVAGSTTSSDAFTVDTMAPNAPTVTLIEDANNNSYVSASEASGPANVRVTLDASAAAGDTLTVMDSRGSVTAVTITAADISAQAVEVSFPAPAEGQSLSVWAFLTDRAGNSSADSAADLATWDRLAPVAPVASLAPASDTGLNMGDHLTRDSTPTIQGVGEPGNSIRVVMPGTGEVLVTTAAANGSWSVTPTQDLPNGLDHAVSVTQSDAAGNVSAATTVLVSVDTVGPGFTSAAQVTVAENRAANLPVLDVDANEAASYSLGGADAARFSIDTTTGIITFNSSPNYEAPADLGANNVYDLVVTAVDAAGNTANQSLTVTVSDVSEPLLPKGLFAADLFEAGAAEHAIAGLGSAGAAAAGMGHAELPAAAAASCALMPTPFGTAASCLWFTPENL